MLAGASGALYSILGFGAAGNNAARVLWYGLDLSMREALLANMALQLFAKSSYIGATDVAMHAGGAVAGILFFQYLTGGVT